MTSPIVAAHPLDHTGCIKILLGQTASDAIAANGDYHLAIITHPDATSPAEANGRLVLICLPITKQAADNAYMVAKGTHRAARIRVAKP